MTGSTAASLASLPPESRTAILTDLTHEELEQLEHDWRFWARPEQLPPEGLWGQWLYIAGRGAGKTRSGAEWVRGQVMQGAKRVSLIAPTAADARDVMVRGESGLLAVCWEGDRDHEGNAMGRPLYEPSKRLVSWGNGATAMLFSAEEPERLRGPQSDAAWCDEVAAWARAQETWDMAMFGLRLGDHPKAMVTTTPKPIALLRKLMKDSRSVVTRGSTFDNAANLASSALQRYRDTYEGTRLGRQELYAEIMDEAEGALWSRDMLDAAQCDSVPEMKRVVVAIDPAMTNNDNSDETGIIAAGLGVDDRGYVIADRSGRYSPRGWAQEALSLASEVGADRIVAEANNGGDTIEHTIRTEDPRASVKTVHASKGKRARAEPVAALYEQHRVSHVRGLDGLEDQLVAWEPLGDQRSPDRLDAMVWALTELMLNKTAAYPGFVGD